MRTRLAHFFNPLAPVVSWKVALLCFAYAIVANSYIKSVDLENLRGQSVFFAGCASVIGAFFIAWMTRGGGVNRSSFLMLPVSVMVGLAFVMPSTEMLLSLDRKPVFLFLTAFMLSAAFFLPFYVTQVVKLQRTLISVPILAALLTLVISLAVRWGKSLHLLLMPEWFYGRTHAEFAAMRFGVALALVMGALVLVIFVTYQINATRLQAGLPVVDGSKKKRQFGKVDWNVVFFHMIGCVWIVSLLIIFLQQSLEWDFSVHLVFQMCLVAVWFGVAMMTLLIDYHIPKLSRWAVMMPFSFVAALAGAGIFIFALDNEASANLRLAVFAITFLTLIIALILPLIVGGELRPTRAAITILVLAVLVPVSGGLSGILVVGFFELVIFYRPEREIFLAPSMLAGMGSGLAVSSSFAALFIIRQIRVTRGILQPSSGVLDFVLDLFLGSDEPLRTSRMETVTEKPKGKPKIILTVTTRQLNTAIYVGAGVLVILVLFGALWTLTYAPPPPPTPNPTATHTATAMLTPNANLAVTATDWRSPDVIAATELARGNNSPLNTVAECRVQPVTSPERIAFTTRAAGQIDIFIAEAGNMANACRLTNTVEYEYYLAWSHDGERIMFSRNSADGNNTVSLLVIDVSSGEVITLPTENRAGGLNFTWSLDDAEILYRQFSQNNSMGIYAIASDGRTPPRAVYDSPQFESQPAWSSDGTRIVFGAGMDDGHLQLYVIDEDGENPHQITPDGLYASVPAWSPDDTHVVFIGSSQTIIVLDLASGEMSEISVPEATRNFLPRFSSNNTLTVSATRNLIPNVYEIDLSGRILRNLTPDLNVGAYSLWRSSEQ